MPTLDSIAARADQLDADAARAAGDDQPQGTGAVAPAEPAPMTPRQRNEAAIGFALASFRVVAGRLLKVQSLDRTLADPVIAQIAPPWAEVAEHYGVDLGSAIDHPLARAALLTGPLLWSAWSELADELRARRAAAGDEPAKAAPPPAAPAAVQ